MSFRHEEVLVRQGARSGLTLIIAVHSTTLGDAAGGCRMWRYADWRDGLEDALRLSEAMTMKSALADLPVGGGKSVIALRPDDEVMPERRRDVFHDLGDAIESLGGRYGVGEDVGTSADDMVWVRERTEHVFCLPEDQGGTGEPSEPTAVGVYAGLQAVARRLYQEDTLDRRTVTIVGLGQVGGRLARRLAKDGALLTVTDVDASKKALADELGARWIEPENAYTNPCDVLVPAALGGVLTPGLVPALQTSAICGPANNQLSDPAVARQLASRGIVWAPDFLVNAGGVIHGVLADIRRRPTEEVVARAMEISGTLTQVLEIADERGVTPLEAATTLAEERLDKARVS